MTEITFHFNVPDQVGHGCRLIRKAFLKGASVVVTGETATLEQLNSGLWQLAPTDFVPHCLVPAAECTVASSPVLLAESLRGLDRHGVLINFGATVPEEFERFERLIEVVTADDGARLAGRQRWRHYASRGYVLKQHDVAAS